MPRLPGWSELYLQRFWFSLSWCWEDSSQYELFQPHNDLPGHFHCFYTHALWRHASVWFYQVLYPILPDFLDCNPFRESPALQVNGETSPVLGRGGLDVPPETQRIVDILADTWRLLADCQLHREISSQLIGYLLFFINASLFNSLMEKGTRVSLSCSRWSSPVMACCSPAAQKRCRCFSLKYHFILDIRRSHLNNVIQCFEYSTEASLHGFFVQNNQNQVII